jgi:spoIIIJ-associated protein
VKSSGGPAELEPMSSIERRIIHLRLKDAAGVSTRSEGEEPYRYVVVDPS